jgi:hypothetical protein
METNCKIRLHSACLVATLAIMNSKHTRTLKALFAKPVSSNIKFTDIEAMVVGLGGQVREGEGSRVALLLNGGVKHAHRPHPGKEAKQYQVREIKEWLTALGVKA